MRRRALLTLAALAAYAMMAASCLSPTLPLPPPDVPDAIAAPSANALWQISGTCIPGAFVWVFNTNTASGVGVEDVAKTGSYHVAIGGTQCDTVWVQQQTVDDTSAQTYFVLEPFANGEPTNPSACP